MSSLNPRSPPEPVAELTVRRADGGILARWPLAAGEYTLGGSRHNDLRLDERGVSGRHARVRVGREGVFIEDLGSRYGTTRDGMLIEGAVPVTRARPVKIGSLLIVAELIEPPAIRDLPVATLPLDARPAASHARSARKPPR